MKLIFVGKEPEADGAVSFTFTPTEPLNWTAGQSIKIELPAGYDTEERRFTIAAAPLETNVVITTRISNSDFKQALNTLLRGQEVIAYNVDGTFAWRESVHPHVFAANGIGITPFYSMLRQRHAEQKPLNATLLYATPRADFVLGKKLEDLAAAHPEFNVIFLPAQRLNADAILPHWQADRLLYVSGSAQKVDELSTDLLTKNVPEEMLMRDWFNGSPLWDER